MRGVFYLRSAAVYKEDGFLLHFSVGTSGRFATIIWYTSRTYGIAAAA